MEVLVKKCWNCDLFKNHSEFHKDKNKSFGLSSQCKNCANTKAKSYHINNFEIKRFKQLKRLYGLNQDGYNELLNKQGGVCKICKKLEISVEPRTGRIRALAVDHCHDTGKIRGLLCKGCNQAIGLLKNNPELCFEAAKYLIDNK